MGTLSGVNEITLSQVRERPNPDAIDHAMAVLLTKKQIKEVTSRTRLGPSKRAIVRRIFTIGVEALQIAEMLYREEDE